jgi:hypothetical protein
MSDTNETDRMNERRRNMGLPPITQRASKPTRQMTTEDIREYLEEVKAIAEKLFPNQSDRDKYVSDIRSNVKKELLAEKVQLTDDDQILILDRITGKVKTTKIDNIKSKQANEPTQKSKDFFNNKSLDSAEVTSSSIIKILELIKNNDGLAKREKTTEALRAVRNTESIEQLTIALETLSREQQTTIKLLEQLRDKIASSRGGSGSGSGDNSDISNFLKRNAGTIVTGAILGGVAIANAVESIGSNLEPSVTPAVPAVTPAVPAVTPVVPAVTPVVPVVTPTPAAPVVPAVTPTPVVTPTVTPAPAAPVVPAVTPTPVVTPAPAAPVVPAVTPTVTPAPAPAAPVVPVVTPAPVVPAVTPTVIPAPAAPVVPTVTPAAPVTTRLTPALALAPVADAELQTSSSFRTLDASNISRRDNFDQSDITTATSPAGGFEFANENIAQSSVTPITRSQPMTQQVNTSVDEELLVNTAVNEREALTKEYESNPILFSNRNLVLRAKKVTFSSDDIEFKLPAQSAIAQHVPSGGGESPVANLMTPPPSVSGSGSSGSGSSGSGASAEGSGSQQLTTGQASATSTAADTSGLSFAPGVDPRINRDIAQKIKQIEGAFGKSLTITSGFRDEQRNARAGGARNSAHTRANAIDIQFRGNQEETNKLIEVASAAGIGGIGVYRPGWLHLDTESKRVWGPDFTARSIPEWAKDTLQAHMSGQIRRSPTAESSATGSDATPITASESSAPGAAPAAPGSDGGGAGDATPVAAAGSGAPESGSGGAGDATPVSGGESSAPGPVGSSDTGEVTPTTQPIDTAVSGSVVSTASVDNVMAERTPAPQTSSVIDMTADSTNPSLRAPQYNHDPNDPGNVEPDDAAERYARLFDMAA